MYYTKILYFYVTKTSAYSEYCVLENGTNLFLIIDIEEIRQIVRECEDRIVAVGERLARSVRAKDRLRRQQRRLCAAFSVLLRHISKCFFITTIEVCLTKNIACIYC